MDNKGEVGGKVVGVFIGVLVICLVAGMVFLFLSQLKTQTISKTISPSTTMTNESHYVNQTLNYFYLNVEQNGTLEPTCTSIDAAVNATGGEGIDAANYTTSGCKITTTSASTPWQNKTWNITYTYTYTQSYGQAFDATNKSETAGYQVVSYLPLVFLAIIFGVILVVVLKVVLPFLSVGGGEIDTQGLTRTSF